MNKLTQGMTRKQFLTAAAGLVGVAAACAEAGGESSNDDGPDECGANGSGDLDVAIQNNHGHSMQIPFADVEAGETKVYSLGGPHEHTVEVDALVFEKLLDQRAASVGSSSFDGHSHIIELSC